MQEAFTLILTSNNLFSSVVYGEARATLELAFHLASRKDLRVTIACVGTPSFKECNRNNQERLSWIVAPTWEKLLDQIRSLQRTIDCLIEISGVRAFGEIRSKSYIVYQHNPAPILTKNLAAYKLVSTFRIPVVCVSQHSAEIQAKYGVPRELLYVIPNGLSDEFKKPGIQKPRNLHSIIYAGMVIGYKGADIALVAFQTIKQSYPDASLIVCGQNNTWDKGEECLIPANWLDHSRRINWNIVCNDLPGVNYLGEVEPEDLADLFKSSELLVAPSRYEETFGLVSIEAQSQGCLPVLPRRGGFPETLQDRNTGYCYDTNNPEELAASICNLWDLKLPSDCQRIEAQHWVRETFTWSKAAVAFAALIRNHACHTSLLTSCWPLRKFMLLILFAKREVALRAHRYYKQK